MMPSAIMDIFKEALRIEKGIIIPLFNMCIRGLIIYCSGILLTRLDRKIMGIRTPFNFILFVMIGSASAAAIIGEVPFIPVYGTLLFLLILDKLIAAISFYFPRFEKLVKGSPLMLIIKGEMQWEVMKKNYITEREIRSALQTQLHTNDFSNIEYAYLASDGTINFIIKEHNLN